MTEASSKPRTTCDVLVVGAGPAGSAVAWALARAGLHVLVCDRGTRGPHRLCGEFISSDALGDLALLGVDLNADATRVDAARVFAAGRCVQVPFSPPGQAVSRHLLDAALVDAATAVGGRFRFRTRVRGLRGNPATGYTAMLQPVPPSTARAAEVQARVVVLATGKRSTLAKHKRQVALKVHLMGDGVAAGMRALELHAIPGGYVGVACAGQLRTNVCALVQRGTLAGLDRSGGTAALLRQLVQPVPQLNALFDAYPADAASARAATGLGFGRVHPVRQEALAVGDAAGMVYPLLGDGIAMALRSAALASDHVRVFLTGAGRGDAMLRDYERAWRHEFGARVHLSRWLYAVVLRRALLQPAMVLFERFPGVFDSVVRQGRGGSLAADPHAHDSSASDSPSRAP